jgi:hypothetical protein
LFLNSSSLLVGALVLVSPFHFHNFLHLFHDIFGRLDWIGLGWWNETGGWLNTLPNILNGTVLSEEEFRDSLRLRFRLIPLKLPLKCDGYDQALNANHAMKCSKGGLILHHRNDVAPEWGKICTRALKPWVVSNKPHIHTDWDTPKATGTTGAPIDPDLKGDIGVKGFWKNSHSMIFDIRITNMDAKSYHSTDPKKVLKQQEQKNQKIYAAACSDQCHHFTPLMFSIDGMCRVEASTAIKLVASLLSAKWKRPYSEICGYVCS